MSDDAKTLDLRDAREYLRASYAALDRLAEVLGEIEEDDRESAAATTLAARADWGD